MRLCLVVLLTVAFSALAGCGDATKHAIEKMDDLSATDWYRHEVHTVYDRPFERIPNTDLTRITIKRHSDHELMTGISDLPEQFAVGDTVHFISVGYTRNRMGAQDEFLYILHGK